MAAPTCWRAALPRAVALVYAFPGCMLAAMATRLQESGGTAPHGRASAAATEAGEALEALARFAAREDSAAPADAATIGGGGGVECGRGAGVVACEGATGDRGRPEAASDDRWLRALPSLLPEELLGQVLQFARFRFRVASCSESSAVTLFGPSGPRVALEEEGDSAEVVGLRFFPLGDRAVTWSLSGAAAVWDAASGRKLRELHHGAKVEAARVFPCGGRVVTFGDDGRGVVWSVDSGEALAVVETEHRAGRTGHFFLHYVGGDIEVFPAGDRLLTWGRNKWASLWNAETGAAICDLHKHASTIEAAEVFRSGQKVVTGGLDNLAIIWNASSCEALFELPHPEWVTGLAVLEVGSGEGVATITIDGQVTLWSGSTGRELRMLLGPNFPQVQQLDVGFLPFPQGDRLLTFNRREATIWDVVDGEPVHHLVGLPKGLYGLAVSPGGEVVVMCGGGEVTIWDAATGQILSSLVEERRRPPHRLAVHGRPESCFVAVTMGGVFDPDGFGAGLSWEEISQLERRGAL